MKVFFLIIILVTCLSSTSAQTPFNIDSLLSSISGKSENVRQHPSAKKILVKSSKMLMLLARKFTDTTKTTVFSSCARRTLTKGELAIILADQIESLPYYSLTGLQNCMMESCPNNPNFVEFYLEFIRTRGMMPKVQQDYIAWLGSADRKKYR